MTEQVVHVGLVLGVPHDVIGVRPVIDIAEALVKGIKTAEGMLRVTELDVPFRRS